MGHVLYRRLLQMSHRSHLAFRGPRVEGGGVTLSHGGTAPSLCYMLLGLGYSPKPSLVVSACV